MHADRLISLLLLLQSRGRVTAAVVAAELEVSLATARRDLEALSAAGIPIYVQPGRGGGWQLIGDARTNLSGLSVFESRALFWLLGTAGLASPETRVAIMKLIRALPVPLRHEAERLASSIHYDQAAWGEDVRVSADGLEVLREAIVQTRVIRVTYTSRGGDHGTRHLRPLGLVAKAGVWYLVAGDERGPRSYRVERIADAELTEEQFEPPEGFNLVAYWHQHRGEIDALRSGVAATLKVTHPVALVLQEQFGVYFTAVNTHGEHSVVEVRAHLLVSLAEKLAGWGHRIEVLSPPDLRVELARIGAELVAHHGAN